MHHYSFASYVIYALFLALIGFIIFSLPRIVKKYALKAGGNRYTAKVISSQLNNLNSSIVTYDVSVEYVGKDGSAHQATGQMIYVLTPEEQKKGYKKHVNIGDEFQLVINPKTKRFYE